VPTCKNCQREIKPDTKYENGWAHVVPVPKHDADICHEILIAEPDEPTSITIDFSADELEHVARAMRVTGETFSEFVERAIKNTVERYTNGRP
jgi:hypothetical protein